MESSSTARRRMVVGVVAIAALLGIALVGVASAASSPSWGTPTPVTFAPGLENAVPTSVSAQVSCASAGNCTAVGYFTDVNGDHWANWQTSTNGVWAEAQKVDFPNGMLGAMPISEFHSVSCASPGNCTAVGKFQDTVGSFEGFLQSSTNGVWGTALRPTYPVGVAVVPQGSLESVSCSSPGNCTAVGTTTDLNGDERSYSVTSTNGTWATAVLASLPNGAQGAHLNSTFQSVSCASPGNCAAVGLYLDVNNHRPAFAVSSTNGVWSIGQPSSFAGGVQSAAPEAMLRSVSCASAGSCTAVGYFTDVNGAHQPFSQTSTNGVWGAATPSVFGSGVQSNYPYAGLQSVSCVSVGNCTAVGDYTDQSSHLRAFAQTSIGGSWGLAVPIAFAPEAESVITSSHASSVSCATATTCVAVGEFTSPMITSAVFEWTMTAGSWTTPLQATFAAGVENALPEAVTKSVSCPTVDYCAVVGQFVDPASHYRAFWWTYAVPVDPPTTTSSTPSTSAPSSETPPTFAG